MTTHKCTYQLTINPATCLVLIEKGYPKCQKCPRRPTDARVPAAHQG
jgi:hypothetical protein